MQELKIFEKEEFGKIRTVEIDGEVYFVASDVAKALGYINSRDAVLRHCKGVVKHDIPTNGGKQSMSVIPKGDVLRLAANSELPGAEKFEGWIFDEVIPTVLNHGIYATDDVINKILDNPDFGIGILTKLKEERAARVEAEQKNSILSAENDLLAQKNLEWADRAVINAMVRAYGYGIGGDYRKAWRDFKKELLYRHGININARITNYLNRTEKRTKPKTLDVLDDSELSSALSTITAMCRENGIDISDIIQKKVG